jgi:DNA-binding transcriptional LysR family regulator
LTDAGEFYVEQVIDILQRIEDTETALAARNAAPRGVLRISCPPSFGRHVLTPVIAAYARDNPAVRIELGLQDDEPDVIASRLDLLFRLGALRDSSLISRQVGAAPFVLCAAPSYIERSGRPSALDELERFNCIVDGSVQPESRWEFMVGGKRVGQTVAGNFASLSTEAVIEAAVEGLGLAYVPRYAVVDEFAADEVVELDLAQVEPISLPIHVLYSTRQHMAAKTRGFLDFFIAQVDAQNRTHGVSGRVVQ